MGVVMNAKKPVDEGTLAVLEARARRRQANIDELRKLSKYKRKQKHRLKEGDWPILASTGEKAELDPYDVRAPLPDYMVQDVGPVDEEMLEMRAFADAQPSAFDSAVIEIDETLLIARRNQSEREREDRDRLRAGTWTEELVEARLDEAFRTLFRVSAGGVGPRQYGNGMPTPVREWADYINQAGNKSLKNMVLHRFRGIPSVEEVKRMDDALVWAARYLRDDHPDKAAFVNLGAMWKAWGAKISKKCEEIGVKRQQFYRDRKEAIRMIVEGLVRDGRAPT